MHAMDFYVEGRWVADEARWSGTESAAGMWRASVTPFDAAKPCAKASCGVAIWHDRDYETETGAVARWLALMERYCGWRRREEEAWTQQGIQA